MGTREDRWFEVWYSPGEDILPTWLLVVIPDVLNPGHVLVCDPFENNKVVYHAKSYEEASCWLNEDEYEQVEARVFPDDGFPLPTSSIQQ